MKPNGDDLLRMLLLAWPMGSAENLQGSMGVQSAGAKEPHAVKARLPARTKAWESADVCSWCVCYGGEP